MLLNLFQESFVPEDVASAVSSPVPQILWDGVNALLVVESEIVTTCPADELPSALLAAYYCFNLSYPNGSNHFFSLLEILLLDKVPQKIHPRVSTILSALQNVEEHDD